MPLLSAFASLSNLSLKAQANSPPHTTTPYLTLGLDNGNGSSCKVNRHKPLAGSWLRRILWANYTSEKRLNPGFDIGTDFIANNRICGVDFATVHSYPDQWLTSSNDQSQLSFLNNWLDTHIQDAQNLLRKPLLITEFGKSAKDSGFDTYQRDLLFNIVYNKVYSSAKCGGAAAGGLFLQLLGKNMGTLGDEYEIVLSQSPSTANLIAQQSHKLYQIPKIFERMRNVEMWKRARAVRRAEWLARNKGKRIGH